MDIDEMVTEKRPELMIFSPRASAPSAVMLFDRLYFIPDHSAMASSLNLMNSLFPASFALLRLVCAEAIAPL